MTLEQPKNWARELSQGLVSLKQLTKCGLLTDDDKKAHQKKQEEGLLLNVRIPQVFLESIQQGDPVLTQQFIPRLEEHTVHPEEWEDPIGDEAHTPFPGLTHRYPDRVLLKPTYLCAGYCRFCFRRYKVSKAEHNPTANDMARAVDYIRQHPAIQEVILTGGDPLTLTDTTLFALLEQLHTIEHVQLIRIHTRVPILLPSRIQPAFIHKLKQIQKPMWISVHANHEREFTPEARLALALLADGGFPLVMQSVLLQGVNDSLEALTNLFRTAVTQRVKPYYLHYPDLAKGTKHFRMPFAKAIELVKSLRGVLSGICIPQFIVDIPGGKGKVEVNPHWVRLVAGPSGDSVWELQSPLDGSLVHIPYE